jgi:hypothetical protein
MKAAAGPMKSQWRAQAAWIESALAGGAPFLAGAAPGLTDISAYMNIWFMTRFTPHIAAPLLAGFDRLEAWRGRVEAIGHGERSELTGAEALAIARVAQPGDFTRHDGADPSGLSPGAPVVVMADDYGRDPIGGSLVAANPARIVIAREDADLGRLNLHFPRAGFILASAA